MKKKQYLAPVTMVVATQMEGLMKQAISNFKIETKSNNELFNSGMFVGPVLSDGRYGGSKQEDPAKPDSNPWSAWE